MRKLPLLLIPFSLAIAGPALATSDGRQDDTPVTLCHYLGNGGYITITVDNQGELNGHRHHDDDIIPAPEGGCPTGVTTSTSTSSSSVPTSTTVSTEPTSTTSVLPSTSTSVDSSTTISESTTTTTLPPSTTTVGPTTTSTPTSQDPTTTVGTTAAPPVTTSTTDPEIGTPTLFTSEGRLAETGFDWVYWTVAGLIGLTLGALLVYVSRRFNV